MPARNLELNIEKLGIRNYPRSIIAVFLLECDRQLTHKYLFSVIPLKDSLSSVPPRSLLHGILEILVIFAQLRKLQFSVPSRAN